MFFVNDRTAVLSSMSKRGNNEHVLLSSNAMLQMAGRAGRRGVDDQGHVVVVQTPFEGAEECCEVLLAVNLWCPNLQPPMEWSLTFLR